jgi:hypothetical protein
MRSTRRSTGDAKRLTRLAGGTAGVPAGLDRVAARFFDYPRTLAALPAAFDVYHVVDHSYSHLLHGLPPGRTLVTCHDLDTFRSVLQPEEERRSLPFRLMARRILSGLRLAAHVACDSEATRGALVAVAGFPADRLSVIPNGADTGGQPDADATADVEAARMLGPRGGVELLHVGSTIPRKRIDVLLTCSRACAGRARCGDPSAGRSRPSSACAPATWRTGRHPSCRSSIGPRWRRCAAQRARPVLPSDRRVRPSLVGARVGRRWSRRHSGGAAGGRRRRDYCPVEASGAWVETILRLLREARDRRRGVAGAADRGTHARSRLQLVATPRRRRQVSRHCRPPRRAMVPCPL